MLTAPIVFTASGIVVLFLMPELRTRPGSVPAFLRLAEVGLVLLLFADASRTDLRFLLSIRQLPTRLLTAGMLLTIVLGTVAALVCFPQLSIWEAGILAAILAPTDAGLGQIIVTNPHVPGRIRQALNVEAGLNDGLSVPFLLFFMALSGAGHEEAQTARLHRFMLEQLGYGVLIGIGIGLGGGWLLRGAEQRRWMAGGWLPLGVVSLPLLCAVISEHTGASMFIAAFVAGLAVQVGFKQAGQHSVEFAEQWGQLLNLSVFFIFGALVARSFASFSVTHVVYGVLSLTVVRILPVAVALIGTRLSAATVWFMGWFGPRGLASIVLTLVYLEVSDREVAPDDIRLSVMATVLISIFAHGLSAAPLVKYYGCKLATLPTGAPDVQGEELTRPPTSNA